MRTPSGRSRAAEASPAHITTASKVRRRCLARDGQGRLRRICRDAGHVGVELEDSAEPRASSFSSSANWRQLPTSSSGRWMAPAKSVSGFSAGSTSAHLVRADLAELHPGIAQHLQAGACEHARSFSERSSTM
jgi:hypothetical protein